MPEFRCTRKPGSCVRCGSCCRFEGKLNLSDTELCRIRYAFFQKTRLIYLSSIEDMGLPVQTYEYEQLRKHAESLGLKINLIPGKCVYDLHTGKTIVFDWLLECRVCPFLSGTNSCIIYDDRFDICRLFPDTQKNIPDVDIRFEKLQELISKGKIQLPEDMPYEEQIELARSAPRINFEEFLDSLSISKG